MTDNTKRTASIDLAQLDKLEELALSAEHFGHHIYTNLRDSNQWRENEAWHRAASPEVFLDLIELARSSLTSDHRETTSGAPADQALIDMEVRKDAAYYERNQVVAALAKCFPSGVAKTTIEGWSEDWHGCVYIDLPTGQVSWHFHDSQAHLFANLPPYAGKWDGHDTPEKYRRVGALEVSAGAAAKTEQDDPACRACGQAGWHVCRPTAAGAGSAQPEAPNRDAGQEEASAQTVPSTDATVINYGTPVDKSDGAAGTVEKDAALDAAEALLDVLDRYDEQLVPINRKSATVNRLRAAIEAHNKAGKEQGC